MCLSLPEAAPSSQAVVLGPLCLALTTSQAGADRVHSWGGSISRAKNNAHFPVNKSAFQATQCITVHDQMHLSCSMARVNEFSGVKPVEVGDARLVCVCKNWCWHRARCGQRGLSQWLLAPICTESTTLLARHSVNTPHSPGVPLGFDTKTLFWASLECLDIFPVEFHGLEI